MSELDWKSRKNLVGVHLDLIKVVERAAELSQVEFIVTEGLRDLEKQKALYNSGASKTMKSRHLTGHAIDLAAKVAGEIRWDWPLYHKISDAMFKAAQELGIEIEWGGDWVYFKDGPHFQLPWDKYPIK